MAWSICSLIVRYCAWRSTKGIFMGKQPKILDFGYQSSGLKTAKEVSGITRVNAGDGYIFGNNCTGSYDHMIADRNREDRCICSDTRIVAEFSWPLKLRLSCRSSVSEYIVN